MKRTGYIYCPEISAFIHYEYSHDPGVRTFSNGDPGYPPSTEWEITKITTHSDGKELAYLSPIQETIAEKFLDKYVEEHEDDIQGYDDNPDDEYYPEDNDRFELDPDDSLDTDEEENPDEDDWDMMSDKQRENRMSDAYDCAKMRRQDGDL